MLCIECTPSVFFVPSLPLCTPMVLLLNPFPCSLGTVKDLVWDPSGEKLAAIFEGVPTYFHQCKLTCCHGNCTSSTLSLFSDYCAVAILQVRLSPVVEVVFGYVDPQ